MSKLAHDEELFPSFRSVFSSYQRAVAMVHSSMVHAFMGLDRATIKANYPMKRIEPVPKNIGAPWLQSFFKQTSQEGFGQLVSFWHMLIGCYFRQYWDKCAT